MQRGRFFGYTYPPTVLTWVLIKAVLHTLINLCASGLSSKGGRARYESQPPIDIDSGKALKRAENANGKIPTWSYEAILSQNRV